MVGWPTVAFRSAGVPVNQTVFVIDDDEGARESLTFLLRSEGLTCRAFASAEPFLDQLRPDHEGCVVTDLRMPGMDGLQLMERLGERGCGMPVVLLTGHADVRLAVRAMKAGVSDFLEKPYATEDLLRAVRHCLERNRDEQGARSWRETVEQRAGTLTPRESQVYEAVVEGYSNKEIGQQLNLSPRTVEIYRANVMAKMKASSLSELVRMRLGSFAQAA